MHNLNFLPCDISKANSNPSEIKSRLSLQPITLSAETDIGAPLIPEPNYGPDSNEKANQILEQLLLDNSHMFPALNTPQPLTSSSGFPWEVLLSPNNKEHDAKENETKPPFTHLVSTDQPPLNITGIPPSNSIPTSLFAVTDANQTDPLRNQISVVSTPALSSSSSSSSNKYMSLAPHDPERVWKTVFKNNIYFVNDTESDVVITIKTRCEKPCLSTPEKIYSSLKYEILQTTTGTFTANMPFLHSKIVAVDTTSLQEIKKDKPIMKGSVEGALIHPNPQASKSQLINLYSNGISLTPQTLTGNLKVQFNSEVQISYHHTRKEMCWEIHYYDPSDLHTPILIKRSAPFKVFARKPTVSNSTDDLASMEEESKTKSRKKKKDSDAASPPPKRSKSVDSLDNMSDDVQSSYIPQIPLTLVPTSSTIPNNNNNNNFAMPVQTLTSENIYPIFQQMGPQIASSLGINSFHEFELRLNELVKRFIEKLNPQERKFALQLVLSKFLGVLDHQPSNHAQPATLPTNTTGAQFSFLPSNAINNNAIQSNASSTLQQAASTSSIEDTSLRDQQNEISMMDDSALPDIVSPLTQLTNFL